MNRLILLPLVLALAGVAAHSAGQGVSVPKPEARSGEAIFNDKCIYCHDARGWGTRALARRVGSEEPLLSARPNLSADYVAMVVRRGVGSMPAFTPTDLDDAETKVVADWLARPR